MKSSLKEIDGRYYIPAKVVMLSTKESNNLKGNQLWINIEGKLKLSKPNSLCPGPELFQHLYIASDEEIKEGDFLLIIADNLLLGKKHDIVQIDTTRYGMTYYSRLDGTKGWFASEVNYQKDWNYKKIIATTNTTLGLPQPSQSFIKAYIEAYNSGNVITDVLVEYEKRMTDLILGKTITILKIDSGNTITIKKVKECWSREEVEQLLQSAVNDSHCNAFYRVYQKNSNACCEFTNRWIAENL